MPQEDLLSEMRSGKISLVPQVVLIERTTFNFWWKKVENHWKPFKCWRIYSYKKEITLPTLLYVKVVVTYT